MKHQILNVLTIFVQVPVVADWFLVTCSRKRDLYSRHKTTHLTEDADSASVTDFSPSLSLMIFSTDYDLKCWSVCLCFFCNTGVNGDHLWNPVAGTTFFYREIGTLMKRDVKTSFEYFTKTIKM